MKYVYRDGKIVPKPPRRRAEPNLFPTPAYSRFEPMESPVTGHMITSERERQLDMFAAGAFDPRDLPSDHTYTRGRAAQMRENGSGRTESDDVFEWKSPDDT